MGFPARDLSQGGTRDGRAIAVAASLCEAQSRNRMDSHVAHRATATVCPLSLGGRYSQPRLRGAGKARRRRHRRFPRAAAFFPEANCPARCSKSRCSSRQDKYSEHEFRGPALLREETGKNLPARTLSYNSSSNRENPSSRRWIKYLRCSRPLPSLERAAE